MRYTPGPWRILDEEPEKKYLRVRGTVPGEIYKIANVLLADFGTETDLEWFKEKDANEARANARLIAAAPELLEALQNVMPYLYQSSDEFQAALSVIAKATGDSSVQ